MKLKKYLLFAKFTSVLIQGLILLDSNKLAAFLQVKEVIFE